MLKKEIPINLIWLPRLLIIAYTLFISLFALDTMAGSAPMHQKAGGLAMHLIPSLILLITLLVYWKNPLHSGMVFIALGVVFTVWFNTNRDIGIFCMISLPLILAGTLFIACFLASRKKASGNRLSG